MNKELSEMTEQELFTELDVIRAMQATIYDNFISAPYLTISEIQEFKQIHHDYLLKNKDRIYDLMIEINKRAKAFADNAKNKSEL